MRFTKNISRQFHSFYPRKILAIAVLALLNEQHPLILCPKNNDFEGYSGLDIVTDKNSLDFWDIVHNNFSCAMSLIILWIWLKMGYVSFKYKFKPGLYCSVVACSISSTLAASEIVKSFRGPANLQERDTATDTSKKIIVAK